MGVGMLMLMLITSENHGETMPHKWTKRGGALMQVALPTNSG